MGSNVVKLTISVPEDLVIMADKVAKERKTSRSKVVSSCLEELAKQRFVAEMEAGYKAMASDEWREKDAKEWAEFTIKDVENETR
jgi:metal-responsive CopG/Arc/MetJ family transcriptional regulator